jgi:hypothetical protein
MMNFDLKSKTEYSEEYKKYFDGLTEEQRRREIQKTIETITINSAKNVLIEKIKDIRKTRDELLLKSDFYFSVPDVNIDDEKKTRIIKYRQELRDLPNKIEGEILHINNEEINIITTSLEDLFEYLPKI